MEECEHAQTNILATVTEGVVHDVCEVVTQSSFAVTQQHKASGGKWMFHV